MREQKDWRQNAPCDIFAFHLSVVLLRFGVLQVVDEDGDARYAWLSTNVNYS